MTINQRDGRALRQEALDATRAYAEWCDYDETMWDACSEDAEAIGNAEARRKLAYEALSKIQSADMRVAGYHRDHAGTAPESQAS